MNNTKKIASIIALVFVGLIAATAILLAIIPISFNKQIVASDAVGVTVKVFDIGENYFTRDTNEFKEISKLYDKSHNENILLSLFQGMFGKDAKVEEKHVSSTTYDSATSIRFEYGSANKHTLSIKGKTYTSTSNSNGIEYTSLVVTVSNSKNMDEYTIYLLNDNNCNCSITAYAEQTKLYNYLTSLDLHSA